MEVMPLIATGYEVSSIQKTRPLSAVLSSSTSAAETSSRFEGRDDPPATNPDRPAIE